MAGEALETWRTGPHRGFFPRARRRKLPSGHSPRSPLRTLSCERSQEGPSRGTGERARERIFVRSGGEAVSAANVMLRLTVVIAHCHTVMPSLLPQGHSLV